MGRRPPLHAVAWLTWALAAAACVQLAPSPAYVVLVIAAAALVAELHGTDTALGRAFPALVALGVVFALVRIVLTAATTHGVGRVLVTLPEVTLPRLLGGFTVGGTVELEVVLQAAAEGLVIVALMAVFGAFNAVVSHYQLVQVAPRAFHEPGLVVTVALAFVPSTLAAVQTVRESDRARTGGRVVRRGRVLRLVVPVLETGMERAMHLAESMDARGFGHLEASAGERVAAWCGLGSLLSLGAAFVALVGRANVAAVVLGTVGLALLAAAVWCASRAAGLARYRPQPVTAADRWVLAVVALAPVGLALLSIAGDDSLRWAASPLALPAFDPLVGLALLPLLAPALLVRR